MSDSDEKSEQEPSMEEILASIRRIISEDDAEGEEGQDSASEDAAPEDAAEAPVVEEEEEPPVDETDDDVLELTDEIEGDSDDEIMELTDEPEVVDIMEVEEELEPEPEPIEAEPATVDQPIAPPMDTDLISPPPASEATSQFSVLAAAVAGDRLGQTMGVGARTIEDLVKEVMRPMIKEWLDAHLPALVERLVGREIDRMARRAEDDTDD